MTCSVLVDYELNENGWANFSLSIGASSARVGPFGYCSDALGDLIRMALMIATSACRAEASFDGEPQEWRLIIGEGFRRTLSQDRLRVRVLVFPDLQRQSPEEQGNLIFEGYTSADEFARAVLMAGQAVLEKRYWKSTEQTATTRRGGK